MERLWWNHRVDEGVKNIGRFTQQQDGGKS